MLNELLPKLPLLLLVAIVAGICSVGLLLLFAMLLNQIGIAFESRQQKLVRRFFTKENPRQSIARVELTATEPSRWVVGVFFGSARPPQCKYFAVDRTTESVVELVDDSHYAPTNYY